MDSLVLIDAGAPPPVPFSRAAHAGCLSFEFSVGTERIVVNCGNPGWRRADLRASARTTAAHSTLIINDISSCFFSAQAGIQSWFEDEILSGPTRVPVARAETAEETSVEASHDGYQRRFGLIHHRKMALQADGRRFRGQDCLAATRESDLNDVAYAIRFHIHPTVSVSQIWNGAGVMLRTAEGVSLTFEAGGLPVNVEESIFFASPGGPRSCEQIVVHGVAADINEVSWSFRILASDAEDQAIDSADRP